MSVATRPKAAWDTRAYQRIVDARYRDGELIVLFEDYTWARVDVRRLLPPDRREVDWAALKSNVYEIVVPTAEGELELSWLAIRSRTDPAFSEHLAAAAVREASQIGRQITELRRHRELSGDQLAERAEITPEILSRIEQGEADVTFPTLRRILAAMDATLQDLTVNPDDGR